MIRFFRGSGAGPAMLLTLAALGLWSGFFISPPRLANITGRNIMPLWGYITQALEGSPHLAVLLSFALMMTVAIVMIRFNTEFFFIPRRTFLPALLFILLYSIFPGEMILNPALPASLLILAAIWRMISSYRVNGTSFKFFDAALMISSAGLLYAGSVWFILIVLTGVLLLRSPDIRELTLAIAGALLPWVLMYAVWYVTGGDPGDLTSTILLNLFGEAPSVYWSRTLVILLVVTGLNFLPSLVYLAREMPTYKIRSRRTYEILIWVMVISAAAYIFVPAVSAELMAVAAMPLSFIMANYMAFTRRVVTAEILFWMMAAMIVVSRIWPY
ncbi:MAG: DUF6427 family protein [Bacteroidales bacterium]|jgi:hypothetical protein|nr:DUF6427 family protein [Bacteroidales bacterium]